MEYEISYSQNKFLGIQNLLKDNIFDILSASSEEELNNENSFGLKNKDIELYLEDFRKNQKIGNGAFLYLWKNNKDSGSKKFNELSRGTLYGSFIKEAEWRNISNIAKDLRPYLRKGKIEHHIELGLGYEDFTLLHSSIDPSISHLKDTTLTGVDISGIQLENAKKHIENFVYNRNKNLNFKVNGEMKTFDDKKLTVFDTSKNQAYYIFGGTIGNFDKEKIVRLISMMKSNQLYKGIPSIITYFSAPDKSSKDYTKNIDKIKAIYGDPNKNNKFYDKRTNAVFEDFVLSGFRALGVDIKKVKYKVIYDDVITEDNPFQSIKLGIEVNKGETISIKINNKEYIWNEGECLWAIKSQRFTAKDFLDLVKSAGSYIRAIKDEAGVSTALIENKKTLNGAVKDLVKKYNKPRTRVIIGTVALAMASSYTHRENNKENQKKEFRAEQISKMDIRKDDEITMERPEVESIKEKNTIIENKLKNIKSILKSIYLGELDDDEYNKVYNKFEETIYSEKKLYVYMNNDNGKRHNLIYDLKYVTDIIDNNTDFSNIKKFSFLEKYEKNMISSLEKGENYINISDEKFEGFFTTDGRFLEKKVDIRNYFLQKYNDPIKNIVGYFKLIFYPENKDNERIENYSLNMMSDLKKANENYRLLLKDIILKGVYRKKGMNGNDMFDYIYNFTKNYNLEKINQYTKYEKYRDIFEYTDSLYKPVQLEDDIFKKRYELEYIGNYYYMGVESMCDVYVGYYNGRKVLFASIHNDFATTFYSLYLGEQIAHDYIGRKLLNS